ncbi:hypothetical protein H1C71_034992 [Ictidomys tridecemlineatus]|nr:hypothetical protein H1C71_034992 [Ictidomys tridecemlineatus]
MRTNGSPRSCVAVQWRPHTGEPAPKADAESSALHRTRSRQSAVRGDLCPGWAGFPVSSVSRRHTGKQRQPSSALAHLSSSDDQASLTWPALWDAGHARETPRQQEWFPGHQARLPSRKEACVSFHVNVAYGLTHARKAGRHAGCQFCPSALWDSSLSLDM